MLIKKKRKSYFKRRLQLKENIKKTKLGNIKEEFVKLKGKYRRKHMYMYR